MFFIFRIMNSQFHSNEPDPDAIKMFAGQIPRYMDENDLQKLFEEFGPVYQINVLRDKFTNQSKGKVYSSFFIDSILNKLLITCAKEGLTMYLVTWWHLKSGT